MNMDLFNECEINIYYTVDNSFSFLFPIPCKKCFKEFIVSQLHSGFKDPWPDHQELCIFSCAYCDEIFYLEYLGYDVNKTNHHYTPRYMFYFKK